MFYFLDEPITDFPRTASGGLGSNAIIAIVVSIFIVIAVALLIVSILKTKK